MENEDMNLQLSFDDDITLDEKAITKEKSEMISKITKAKDNDYKMPKDLYLKLMSSNIHPNVYAILINGAMQFNLTYDRCHKNDEDITRINTVDVYKKILYSNSVLLFATTLTTLKLVAADCVECYEKEATYVYNRCLYLTINYLKENRKLLPPFLTYSSIDWNDNVDFLLTCINELEIDDKTLWKNIIREKLLNKENMNILFKNKPILNLMYLILCGTKFSSQDTKKIKLFLRLEKVQEEIKSFDAYFYRKKIVPIINKTKKQDIPMKSEEMLYRLYISEINKILVDYNDPDSEKCQISFFDQDVIVKSLV